MFANPNQKGLSLVMVSIFLILIGIKLLKEQAQGDAMLIGMGWLAIVAGIIMVVLSVNSMRR